MNWYLDFLYSIKSFAVEESKIAVACSGGADSMFLTYALASVFGENNIMAIIINHNLQSNSSDVAKQTRDILINCGINAKILVWNHNEILTAIEEKARIARYNLIADFCMHNGIDTVFLGHHIDDKIETFFLNAMRACGLAGLSSMRQETTRNGVRYIRPMVHSIEKSQILEFMIANKLEWFDDKTNYDVKFTRNRVRKMCNFSRQEKLGIVKTMQNIENFYDDKIAEIRHFVTTNGIEKNGLFKIDCRIIAQTSQTDFRYFILVVIFEKIYKFTNWELRQSGVDKIFNWVLNGVGAMTFAKCIFYKKNGLVCVAPEWKILKSVQCIGGEKTCWNSLVNLLSECSAVIKPLGMVESNLRKTLQIKEKFWEIAHLPAVVCDGKISVPHLNILEFDVKLYEN